MQFFPKTKIDFKKRKSLYDPKLGYFLNLYLETPVFTL